MANIRYGVCNAMIEVLNEEIESLPSEVLEQLDCGDFIIKVTGKQKHRYVVTYKEKGVGICFSYFACGYIETISYDKVDGAWVFNSKDVWVAPEEEITTTTH